jgi:hypothetical protein
MQVTSKYNAKIQHETLRIAVCDVLEEILNDVSTVPVLLKKFRFLLYIFFINPRHNPKKHGWIAMLQPDLSCMV